LSDRAPATPDATRPEARRFVRAPLAATVTYAASDMPQKTCRSADIGGGGIRLAIPGELDPGTTLMMRFRLPDAEREIIARGKIVMSFFDGATALQMHGIAFTQIDPADQAAIIRYVEAVVEAAP